MGQFVVKRVGCKANFSFDGKCSTNFWERTWSNRRNERCVNPHIIIRWMLNTTWAHPRLKCELPYEFSVKKKNSSERVNPGRNSFRRKRIRLRPSDSKIRPDFPEKPGKLWGADVHLAHPAGRLFYGFHYFCTLLVGIRRGEPLIFYLIHCVEKIVLELQHIGYVSIFFLWYKRYPDYIILLKYYNWTL